MSAASGLRNAAAEVSAPAVSSCPRSRRASARVLRAWNIEDLRRIAKKRLPRAIFDFFDGAAEDETTLRENRAAFERVRLAPKMLAGVARIASTERQIVHGALACGGNPRGDGAREGLEERVHDALRRFHISSGNGCGRERVHDRAARRDHANGAHQG